MTLGSLLIIFDFQAATFEGLCMERYVHTVKFKLIFSVLPYNTVCTLEPEKGPCNQTFNMWYYNSYSQNCLPFVFGGCFGNKNRFGSKEICELTCEGVSKKKETRDDIWDEVSDTSPATRRYEETTTTDVTDNLSTTTSYSDEGGAFLTTTSSFRRTFDDG